MKVAESKKDDRLLIPDRGTMSLCQVCYFNQRRLLTVR